MVDMQEIYESAFNDELQKIAGQYGTTKLIREGKNLSKDGFERLVTLLQKGRRKSQEKYMQGATSKNMESNIDKIKALKRDKALRNISASKKNQDEIRKVAASFDFEKLSYKSVLKKRFKNAYQRLKRSKIKRF